MNHWCELLNIQHRKLVHSVLSFHVCCVWSEICMQASYPLILCMNVWSWVSVCHLQWRAANANCVEGDVCAEPNLLSKEQRLTIVPEHPFIIVNCNRLSLQVHFLTRWSNRIKQNPSHSAQQRTIDMHLFDERTEQEIWSAGCLARTNDVSQFDKGNRKRSWAVYTHSA